ncbi:MAG: 2-amino-4-hydroxy-6-hydroxymethyldihydropteridine diphosphokinase [Emcibacter sp.]|nr:2-amino-4-hydroxy-6-hydroxymethyldihydropteridine diphosphokinase [Emcibacter sp.]
MIIIGLGSNLTGQHFDSPKAVLEAALIKMPDYGIEIKILSRFYETEPVPKSDQPWFINAVALVETKLSAEELLHSLHEIEESFGRKRRIKWEARILDLDLLAYGDEIYPRKDKGQETVQDNASLGMIIPHPRLQERLFVLEPLSEICPHWRHPVLGLTVDELRHDMKRRSDQGIIRPLC